MEKDVRIMMTGGEPTLNPEFRKIMDTIGFVEVKNREMRDVKLDTLQLDVPGLIMGNNCEEELFNRFLQNDRISLPDIDDVPSDEEGKEFVEYAMAKHGEGKVSSVLPFNYNRKYMEDVNMIFKKGAIIDIR